MSQVIAARGITQRVGSRVLLSDVSLEAAAGEVLALVGPNGAGKTTLLRVLAGDLQPTAGEVMLAGRPISAWSMRECAQMRAVLPQQSALTFPLSCYDVVLLGRTPHSDGHEGSRDHAVVRSAMTATDTRVYSERVYPTLSGGERQRVQTARVLTQIWEGPNFRALLLDEPTASLDLAHQHGLLRLARRMADDQCAVICVLHDLNLAAQYASRLAVLHNGCVRAVGPPADVLTPALLADVFHVEARIVPHPELGFPVIITRGPIDRRSELQHTERIDP